MKRIIIILAAVIVSFACFAQESTIRVVLKNGTSFTGALKELSPTSHIIISISGVESRINMSDVSEIVSCNVQHSFSDHVNVNTHGDVSEFNPHYHIPELVLKAEQISMPEEYVLKVANVDIPMILIRGGEFTMGYDGRGSRIMNSEPVHQVFVSSFYISTSSLSRKDVAAILQQKKAPSMKGPYYTLFYKDAITIVDKISEYTSLDVRLPTESEWEYIAQNETNRAIFTSGETNFCIDYFGEYPEDIRLYINPTGPSEGNCHICRTFGPSKKEYCNRPKIDEHSTLGKSTHASIRIVIPAKIIIQSNRQ
ncbi:MAG: SUMF1/EgtB/PvdO family nonheme iron enzyme [Bacteroidales bacterium]|nr:SUMF1/EgtB/PvdO family nonheme iron enzyme [Bacteroidales bacterium]